MISVGDTIPNVQIARVGDDGAELCDTAELFAGKTVALFAVPGAFTPTCSAAHLPGFRDAADAFAAAAVDLICCLSVNDAFVMKAWGEHHGVGDRIVLLADGNADFTRSLGLDVDASAYRMGTRSRRYAMLVVDNVVQILNVEAGGEFLVSSAERLLADLPRV